MCIDGLHGDALVVCYIKDFDVSEGRLLLGGLACEDAFCMARLEHVCVDSPTPKG